MPLEIRATDERSITVPIPATKVDSAAFAAFVFRAHNDGYYLKSASTLTAGHQRDPYTVGVRLTYSK